MTSVFLLDGSVDKVMHTNFYLKMDVDKVVTSGVRPLEAGMFFDGADDVV